MTPVVASLSYRLVAVSVSTPPIATGRNRCRAAPYLTRPDHCGWVESRRRRFDGGVLCRAASVHAPRRYVVPRIRHRIRRRYFL